MEQPTRGAPPAWGGAPPRAPPASRPRRRNPPPPPPRAGAARGRGGSRRGPRIVSIHAGERNNFRTDSNRGVCTELFDRLSALNDAHAAKNFNTASAALFTNSKHQQTNLMKIRQHLTVSRCYSFPTLYSSRRARDEARARRHHLQGRIQRSQI